MAENTLWPTAQKVPDAVKNIVAAFYKLADTNSADAPDELASLFVEDGVFHSLAGVTKGRQEIAASRPRSWKGISLRMHQPLKVYINNPDSSDLLVIVNLSATLTNGRTVDTEAVAQFNLAGDIGTNPKIAGYKAWGDSAPWLKAMKGE